MPTGSSRCSQDEILHTATASSSRARVDSISCRVEHSTAFSICLHVFGLQIAGSMEEETSDLDASWAGCQVLMTFWGQCGIWAGGTMHPAHQPQLPSSAAAAMMISPLKGGRQESTRCIIPQLHNLQLLWRLLAALCRQVRDAW